MLDLAGHAAERRRVTRTDPDPRVRHRADALLLLAGGRSMEEVAQGMGRGAKRIRVWRRRFLAEGRTGLADRPRTGRPPALDAAAAALLERALTDPPLEHGYPVTIWTVADPTDLLGQRGWTVGRATVSRRPPALGYRSRRPRHDPTHRRDAEAVASAKHVLADLRKRGHLPGRASGLSTWTNAICTPTPTWQRAGSGGGAR